MQTLTRAEQQQRLGIGGSIAPDRRRHQVDLLLRAHGLLSPDGQEDQAEMEQIAGPLLRSFREQQRRLRTQRCAADARVEQFLADHFADLGVSLRLPDQSVVLAQHGVARVLSLPRENDSHAGPLLTSYRVRNGVLHNPKSDRRTTQGTFHVAEGGLPIPGDKIAVPRRAFAEMFRLAMNPPNDLMTLPYTAGQPEPARTFVSLLLRPLVCPEVPGVCTSKSMEVRFFAPGSLVSNLDFVESIFGNGGDPELPENDAGLDVEHWTGHTGCVILAPHLVEVTKKELGLPHHDQATERQRRDGMCWRDEGQKYNDGSAFKVTCRTSAGVIVTIIADNYYGYCKKEVKTQVSYAANLYGNVEEEHSGGALAFPSWSLGTEYSPSGSSLRTGRTFADVARDYGSFIDVRPEGYGVDKRFPELIYIPETSRASVDRQQIWWPDAGGKEQTIPLQPDHVYMSPWGGKMRFEKHPGAPSWRLIGTAGEGVFCHKPCTVSGGGKSEISKSLRDYMLYGPIFVADAEKDIALLREIFAYDFSRRWCTDAPDKPDYTEQGRQSRPILSPARSLGSVIKLLTPTDEYSDEYNRWLASIPNYVLAMLFIIKRFHKQEWGDDWESHFSVDVVNGFPGHELKLHGRKLVGTYLRVGLLPGNAWRTFKLRQDFAAAAKVQTEDDISASVVVPASQLENLPPGRNAQAFKFVENCEYRLFQRPDEAIHRGFDAQTESDLAQDANFISNFQPLTTAEARDIVERVADFEQFTPPMKAMLTAAARNKEGFVVSSDRPRLVDGKPTKNPRYLQTRPDLVTPLDRYVAEVGLRLSRAIPADKPVYAPVDAVLIGRRNNPPDPKNSIRALAVYNPIHYQELPELFMDFICSLTGKSPSTTGAGSEGALTKGPFNALRPIIDLNNALVSYVLTGLGGFSTSAGYVGPNVRVDHDVSLLVPEIWCRLDPEERDAVAMIKRGHLEPLRDFTHKGELIPASRLGYRITERFVRGFFGRLFDHPSKVFDEPILRPETQDLESFVDGIKNIAEAQKRVAQTYLDDGSIDDACPPLRALLTIMAKGSFEGKDAQHADIRRMFSRENLLASDWYAARLERKQAHDLRLWKRHVDYLEGFLRDESSRAEAGRLGIENRKARAAAEVARAASAAYRQSLVGTLGLDPSVG